MHEEQKLIDYIESYLRGELSASQRVNFNKLCVEDPSTHSKLMEHQALMKALVDYNQRRNFIQGLQDGFERFNRAQQHKDKVFYLPWNISSFYTQYKAHLSIAATVALVAVITTLQSVGYFSNKSVSENYSLLRREVNKLKHSQSALLKNINAKTISPRLNPQRFGGTGFIISSDHLLTNYHVIQGADSIYIQHTNGESFKAKQVYVDRIHDLAVLQVLDSNFAKLKSLPYSFKKEPAELGEEVFTLGFPGDKSVYGKGYISSSIGYSGDTLAYQISIPVNPGNSGGPLLDTQGNIVGMVSGKELYFDGAAFAIKSNFLIKSLEKRSQDTFEAKLKFNSKNLLSKLSRKEQLKKLEDYIFMVKVY